MTATSKAEPSIEELISMLKRTGLPTVVVEGQDDMIVYRKLEAQLDNIGISILPVGGRLNVLEIFLRRNELPASVRLAFIADQDTWVNTGVPPDYAHPLLILTSGYSIENDIFTDGNLINLLTPQENTKFLAELQEFIEWYSLALHRHLSDAAHPIARHPEQVLDPAQRPNLLALKNGEHYPETLRQLIANDYAKLLRGKSLLALLVRNTNYKGRHPRHTDKAFMEMVAIRPGPSLQRVAQEVEAAFANV